MADIIDLAQDVIDREDSYRVLAAQAVAAADAKRLAEQTTGECLFCFEKLPPNVLAAVDPRWCDADCRDEWQRRVRLAR